jgi:hypothetical protein
MSGSVNSLSGSGTPPAAGGDESLAADGDGIQPAAAQPIAATQLEIQLFRGLMAAPRPAWQWAELAARDIAPRTDSDGFRYPDDESRRGEPDVSSQLSSQHVVDSAPLVQGNAAAGASEPTFAELVEKHVRRALASADDGPGGEIQIELSDAALPGTALSLRRTSEGWQLLAISGNKRSREMLARFAPALVARFAECSLGRLQVSLEDMGATSPMAIELTARTL